MYALLPVKEIEWKIVKQQGKKAWCKLQLWVSG